MVQWISKTRTVDVLGDGDEAQPFTVLVVEHIQKQAASLTVLPIKGSAVEPLCTAAHLLLYSTRGEMANLSLQGYKWCNECIRTLLDFVGFVDLFERFWLQKKGSNSPKERE